MLYLMWHIHYIRLQLTKMQSTVYSGTKSLSKTCTFIIHNFLCQHHLDNATCMCLAGVSLLC